MNRTCHYCKYVAANATNLERHLARQDKCFTELTPEILAAPYRCEWCNQVFARKWTLDRHIEKCPILHAPEDQVREQAQQANNIRRADIATAIEVDELRHTVQLLQAQLQALQRTVPENEVTDSVPLDAAVSSLARTPAPKLAPVIHAPTVSSTGYVYFITREPFDGKVKIGMSVNPIRRLATLQTGNHEKLVARHVFESPDYKTLERTLHQLCAGSRARGEWFDMSWEDLTALIGA